MNKDELPEEFQHLADKTQMGLLAAVFHEMFSAFMSEGFERAEAFELTRLQFIASLGSGEDDS